jgi:hypothetical protein
MLLLLAAGGVVAWRIPLPANLPTLAWNSEWVFRAEIFAGFFIGVYVLLVIAITTVTSGRPPQKLTFGMLSFEQASLEKTVDALSEGGTAIQALEREMRELQARLDHVLAATRAAHEVLIELAASLPKDEGEPIASRAREQISVLSEQPGEQEGPRRELERAMNRFDQLLAELEQLRARRDG